MKFYRVHKFEQQASSHGFQFFTDKLEAGAYAALWHRQNGGEVDGNTLTTIEIEPTKQGILNALNRYASHPDNG